MSTAAVRQPLPILTSLRFFAAADVVVFHALLPWQNEFLRGIASSGYEAVTFFFVLSGFILTYVYSGASDGAGLNVDASGFWKARLARISPAYYLGLALLLPTLLYAMLISKNVPLERGLPALVLTPVFLQSWWPPAAVYWNAPAWSLSAEFFFYALFPLLLPMLARGPRNALLLFSYGFVVAMTIFRFFVLSPDAPVETYAYKFEMLFPLLHLPQFVFGMALGRAFLFGSAFSRKAHIAMLWIGIAGILVAFGEKDQLPWWIQTDGFLVLLYGLIIFGGAGAESGFRTLVSPPLILLGEASYAIYILHMPIQFWWSWFLRKMLRISLPVFVDFTLYFVLVIALSILTYRYVEKPLRRWILGHREHRAA